MKEPAPGCNFTSGVDKPYLRMDNFSQRCFSFKKSLEDHLFF